MYRTTVLSALLIILVSACFAQKTETGIVLAANQFIGMLDKAQQSKAVLEFTSDERYTFYFVPRDDRKGISLNELNEKQRAAGMNFLRSCLSDAAFQKANDITQLEIILKALEKRTADDHYRDPGKYFISIFGKPGLNTTWGWRFEGHHISFNFSTQNNKLVAGTPGFLGSNPAIVQEGPGKGKQILKDETELGLALVKMFNSKQLEKVIMDSIAPADIFTFNKRKALFEKTAGIGYGEMTPEQRQAFMTLLKLYIHRYTKLFADDMMQEIQKAGLEKLQFAWAGAAETGPGHPHYYRIQGPTIIIEYDNTQNNGNHVHSVVRDLLHDFGGDELLEHYKSAH